jgi:hypothetical protein
MPEKCRPCACDRCIRTREPYRVLREVWILLLRDAGLTPETRRHLRVAYDAALEPRLEPKLRRVLSGTCEK